MASYSESPESTYDVIVCGAGPAGLGAAISARLSGARVLLLEATGTPGGSSVKLMWIPQNRILLSGKSRGGVCDQFVSRLMTYGSAALRPGVVNDKDDDNLNVHPEYLRMCAFDLLAESGCDFLLHSAVRDVIMEGKRITGVVVKDRMEERRYMASVVIDATGDGDVAYFAGCEMSQGREYDGIFMPMTVPYSLANVDTARFFAALDDNPHLVDEYTRRAEKMDYLTTQHYWLRFPGTIDGVLTCNNDGLGASALNGVNPEDATLMDRIGLQFAADFVEWARLLKLPGFEHAFLMRASCACARETRRIVGEYVLTLQDILSAHVSDYEDVVARRYGTIESVYYSHTMPQGVGYPYRCMLPKRVDGLLVAGRCGSATHLGQASGKSMGNIMEIGQAAGTAAALCAQQGMIPRDADVRIIQRRLEAAGIRLNANEGEGRSDHAEL